MSGCFEILRDRFLDRKLKIAFNLRYRCIFRGGGGEQEKNDETLYERYTYSYITHLKTAIHSAQLKTADKYCPFFAHLEWMVAYTSRLIEGKLNDVRRPTVMRR